MGKSVKIFIASLIVPALLLAAGCKKKDKEAAAFLAPSTLESKGDLRVASATPNGPTGSPRESQSIVVIFDRPMVALEALPEGKGSSFLRMTPSFPGKHRWLGTRALRFTPDKRFPFGTQIRVAVPANVVSVDGYTLKKEFNWDFRTIQPRLLRSFPGNQQKSLKLDTRVLLLFNQPVAGDKAAGFVTFTGKGPQNKDMTVDFSVKHPPAGMLKEEDLPVAPEEALLLEPREPLKPDFTYFIGIKAGLPSTEGPLGSDEAYMFSFETFKTFKFEGLQAGQPDQPLRFHFSNPVPYKSLVGNIKFEPAVVVPDYYASWDSPNSQLWIDLPLKPETEYTATLSPDLADDFGNKLGREIVVRFVTGDLQPSVSMTTGHGVIEAYEAPRIPVTLTNQNRFFIQAANVRPEDVVPLLARRAMWTSERILPRPGFFQIEREQTYAVPRNEVTRVPLELAELCPEKYGLLYIQLDTGSRDKYSRWPKAFLQVTELGLSAKCSPENNVIWVSELRTGRPVAGADVEVRDDANVLRWRGKTDALGKVESPGWKKFGLKPKDEWTKPRQWIFARRGKDIAFTSSEWGTGIYPYRFGIDYDWNPSPSEVEGYLFSERGIYRAGETVHIKGIIRRSERGQWALPSVAEVECEVRDPFQKPVYKGKAALDEFGSFDVDLDISPEASLGNYQVTAEVPAAQDGEKPRTLYDSFRVEAFRPAEFEVILRSVKDGFTFGDPYQGEVRASYLFGGAMAGQKASWSLRLNASSFTPPGHKGFIFGNEMDWDDTGTEESRLLASGEGFLDAEGKMDVKVPLLPGKERDSVQAALEATVQSPSRRSISSRIQTTVHRGEFYIGLRPGTAFVKKGDGLSVDVIAADPGGTLVPKKRIQVRLIRREWRSVRKAGVGGRFGWMTEKEDIEAASLAVDSGSAPMTLPFRPDQAGLYYIRADAKDGRGNPISSSTYFYVTGGDYVPWERRDDDSIELVADGEEYRPGDTAKILVKSPYEKAKALVTVERECILESRVLEIQGSTTQIAVPLSSDHAPNVFVSVLLVQGRTASAGTGENGDVGKPSFKMGYVRLNVNPFQKRLSVAIATDRQDYRPKDRVTVRLKAGNWKGEGVRACISLAVVDVGVLNLIGYQTPNPFERFYAPKPLSVQTSETRIHVVGQRGYGEKGEDAGGGGEITAASAPILTEVELRGDFKSTAYWNPSILANAEGEAVVSFDLPSNLTTFRIMAVAQTADSSFGQGQSTFRVSKPLQLLPSLPRFGRVGDQFEGGVIVHNYSSKPGEVKLSLEAAGIVCKDSALRTFPLAAGESREVLYPFEAAQAGEAEFSFRAAMGEESDGLAVTMPLKLPRPAETVALFGETEESREEQVRIPADVFLDQSRLEVSAAASAMTGLKGCVDFLTSYPYSCLEQRVSQILPYLMAADIIRDFKLSALGEGQIRRFVQSHLNEFAGYQKDDGGFAVWPDSWNAFPYLTCYAAYALLKAREAGYAVDAGSLDRSLDYLRNFLGWTFNRNRHPYSLKLWNTSRAFALYVLALAGKPEPNYAELLAKSGDDLTLFGKSLLLKALYYGDGPVQARNRILDELLNKVKVTPSHAHFEEEEGAENDWIYSSNLRTTAHILQTLVEIKSPNPLLPQIARWIVDKRKAGHWRTTQENFYVFSALNDYFEMFEKRKPDYRLNVSLGGRTVLDDSFRESREKTAEASILLSEFKENELLPLKIRKDGPGALYYSARMTYAPAKKIDARDEGLAVVKRIESVGGTPLASIKAGSLAVVTLEIIVPQETLFVVVDDPLPAGWEAVNPAFLTESEEQRRALDPARDESEFWEPGFNHVEMRDDRVLLFADSLSAGVHTHRYLVRALTHGTFHVPGVRVEQMYNPEVFGLGPETTVRIEK